MNLPPAIGGGAFRDAIGNYTYVLWAKTSIDRSEAAAANYTFPAVLNVAPLLNRKEWNYSITATSTSIPSVSVALTGTPLFLSDNFQLVSIRDRNRPGGNDEKKFALRVYPNPSIHFATVQFTLAAPERVRLTIFDEKGRLVKSVPMPASLPTGTHSIPLIGIQNFSAGVYYCRFETEEVQLMKKLIIAH